MWLGEHMQVTLMRMCEFFPPVEAVSQQQTANKWGRVKGTVGFSFLTKWHKDYNSFFVKLTNSHVEMIPKI